MADKSSKWQLLLSLSFRLLFRRVGTKIKLNKTAFCCCLLTVIAIWLLLSFRMTSKVTTTHPTIDKVKKYISENTEHVQGVNVAFLQNDKYRLKMNSAPPSAPAAEESEEATAVNPHNYRYIINEENRCRRTGEEAAVVGDNSVGDVYLLIGVSSAPQHHDRRLAIRQAWANTKALSRLKVIVLFLLGSTANPKDQIRVDRESETFHDVIQEDFVDSYYNLSIKSVMGLKWAKNFCPNLAYYMKADDDVYVNVELLVEFLRIYGQQRWIGGCVKQLKSPKPLDTNGFPVTMMLGHPSFVAGAGYVISGDIVAELYRSSLRRALVPVEDAYITGYCAQDIGVFPSHYDGFNCGEALNDDCQMKLKFVGHHVSIDKQFQIWKTIHNLKNACPHF